MPFSLRLLAIACVLFASCSRQQSSLPNQRVVIADFDNQSRAEDGWISHEIQLLLADVLLSKPELAVRTVKDSEGWRSSGAGRVILGVYRREPKGIRVEAQLLNVSTGVILTRVNEVVPENALAAFIAERLGKALFEASPAQAPDEAAWREFAQAAMQPNSTGLEALHKARPQFAPAYPVLAERWIREGKRADATPLVGQLPADNFYAAQTALLVADNKKDQLAALVRVAEFRKSDPAVVADLAARASEVGQWDLAQKQYEAMVRVEPANFELWNGLAYAAAQQGKLPEAVAALEQYRKLKPNEPNVLDSFGEVHYINRKFADAARYFDEQMQRYPTFQSGAGLRKAAFAYAQAGDLKTADARFAAWMKQALTMAPPEARALYEAIWLARTGRTNEAKSLMAAQPPSAARDLHTAMLRFGIEGTAPTQAQWAAWAAQIQEPGLRNELTVFALVTQPARIEAATAQPQFANLRQQLLAAVAELAAPAPQKQALATLPPALDGPLDVLLLRKRLAVLP